MKKILLFALLIGLVSCSSEGSESQSVRPTPKSPLAKTQKDSGSPKPEVQAISKNWSRIDSLRHEKPASFKLEFALIEALDKAKNHLDSSAYTLSFESKLKQSDHAIPVDIAYGPLFSAKSQHLLVRRRRGALLNFDLYLHSEDSLLSVFSYEMDLPFYTGDTIWDVNGDGYKDFIVTIYSTSGCCLRNGFEVFLGQKDRKSFLNESVFFLNPTFSPKEKVVRGVTYGWPGEAGLYKFRWRGNEIDTVEYIYQGDPEKENYRRVRGSPEGKATVISRLPEEYKSITDYAYFNTYLAK